MIDALCQNSTLQILICEPLSYAFMQHALAAVLLLGVVTGVVGAFVVVRGMAFLADALGHAILPGVAVAYLAGGVHGPLLLGAMAAGGITALVIGFFTRGGKLREDTAIGIVFTGALALGLAILSLSKATAIDLEEFLVGNVLAVSSSDLVLILAVGAVILVPVLALYKELLIISFDPALGAALQYPIEGLRYLLMVLLAMTAVMAIQAVGVILIAAMMVTPAATAYLLVRRMHWMMLLGSLISCTAGLVGVYLSWILSVVYHLSIAPSAAIVLTMTLFFALAYLFAPKRGAVWAYLQQRQAEHSQTPA
ncbi:MAG TPA: metal ABC transporter permease [Aggregatilineales bacterium]|nr:metal ABC transporter permease [Aggregatilineales bacterium]